MGSREEPVAQLFGRSVFDAAGGFVQLHAAKLLNARFASFITLDDLCPKWQLTKTWHFQFQFSGFCLKLPSVTPSSRIKAVRKALVFFSLQSIDPLQLQAGYPKSLQVNCIQLCRHDLEADSRRS